MGFQVTQCRSVICRLLPFRNMRWATARGAALCLSGLVLGASGMAGCTNVRSGAPTDGVPVSSPPLESTVAPCNPVEGLAVELASLGQNVSVEESRAVAALAVDSARDLAREYRMGRLPLFHNLLVNLGFKQRGLCYHFVEDLLIELQSLPLTSLDLHWGVARPGTWREHNSIVVTAREQPFEEGLVLDAWRKPGRLFWTRVRSDRYPWEEALTDEVSNSDLATPPALVR